jgi:hypothetical protein
MFGTPLVPMMLLTAMTDCSPVMALWPPRNTRDLRADLPAHLIGGIVQHGLLERNPGLRQSLGGQLQDLQRTLLPRMTCDQRTEQQAQYTLIQ